MQVDLKIIKDSVCKSYFMSSTFFNNQSILIDPKIQLCAGKQNGGKGGCLGDAGLYSLKNSFIINICTAFFNKVIHSYFQMKILTS